MYCNSRNTSAAHNHVGCGSDLYDQPHRFGKRDWPAVEAFGHEIASVMDLRCLTACADAGALSRAAKMLGVEISTVSRRISSLEDNLGLSLFERNHSGIRLTRGGRAVVQQARRILDDLEALVHTGRQHASGAIGEIHLGVRVPPIGGAAHTLLCSWRAVFPDVNLKVMEGNEREIAVGLAEHRLDVAIVGGHTTWPHVAACPLFREQLVAVLPSKHQLAQQTSVSWEDISRETILVQGWPGNQTQREYYGTLVSNAARFEAHQASKQTILALVRAGFGITLATDSQAEGSVAEIDFRPVEEPNAWLEFDLVWLPESENPVVGRFVAFLRDESRARGFV